MSAVSEEYGAVLTTALSDLSVQSEASIVILSDSGGNILAESVGASAKMTPTLSALAAGSFAATRELAALVGEESFQSIYQQGEELSIYVHGVGEHYLLLVVFDRNTTVGLVKLYVEKTALEIRPVLARVDGQDVESAGSGETFEMDSSADIFSGLRSEA